MILVVDNFDSFTYNLVQYMGELIKNSDDIKVLRNNQLSIGEIDRMKPSHILISPGPCTPNEAGISTAIFEHFAPRIPILGVCLGHQCLGSSFGAKIVRAKKIMHGKTSLIYHDGKTIYEGLPNPFIATRYHSLIIDRRSCPKILKITAQTKEKEIMGVRHTHYPWAEGIQFHPESILTIEGKKLLKNFLKMKKTRMKR